MAKTKFNGNFPKKYRTWWRDDDDDEKQTMICHYFISIFFLLLAPHKKSAFLRIEAVDYRGMCVRGLRQYVLMSWCLTCSYIQYSTHFHQHQCKCIQFRFCCRKIFQWKKYVVLCVQCYKKKRTNTFIVPATRIQFVFYLKKNPLCCDALSPFVSIHTARLQNILSERLRPRRSNFENKESF